MIKEWCVKLESKLLSLNKPVSMRLKLEEQSGRGQRKSARVHSEVPSSCLKRMNTVRTQANN